MTDKRFEAGDIFYTSAEGKVNIFKLLKVDQEIGTYHVLSYAPLDSLPPAESLNALEIDIYHAPIDSMGFDNPILFTNQVVTSEDLLGYHEYLRQTQEQDFLANMANHYYKNGYQFTSERKHVEAIEEYSKAIDLFPQFFEALDNRGFCKMDLGRWDEAVADFKESLEINPGSFLAEFSIGECYLRMKMFDLAKEQFQKAVDIDPTHQVSIDFLNKATELAGKK